MENSILKFQDKICLENILFVSNIWFSFSSDQHKKTSSSTQGNLMKLFYKTDMEGIQYQCCWAMEQNPKTKKYAT